VQRDHASRSQQRKPVIEVTANALVRVIAVNEQHIERMGPATSRSVVNLTLG
jgi:hypothetical protein